MSVFRMLLDEIWHRKITSLLVVVGVVVAIACLCGAVLFLHGFDRETEDIVAGAEVKVRDTEQKMVETKKEVEAASKALQDDYRKMTKSLGYNLLILPAKLNYENWLADDFGKETMPEETVTKLGETKLVTVNHLLPSLQQKVDWPEKQRKIVLVGVKGQVPIAGRKKKKPIMAKIPEKQVILGTELANSLGLKKGDSLTFHGQEYSVHEIYPPQGNKSDISMWISLDVAQKLTNNADRINAIHALQCLVCENPEDPNRLKPIDQELRTVLGDQVQIKDFGGIALARTKMRLRAQKEAKLQNDRAKGQVALAKSQVEGLRSTRQDLRSKREGLIGVLQTILLFGAMLWLASLALFNVRQRRSEIGILRAVGVSSGRILTLFLGKAALLGAVGAVLGCGVALVAANVRGVPLDRMGAFLIGAGVSAPVVAVLASWLPSLLAIRMDPALALREE